MSKRTEGLAPDVNANWPVRKADADRIGSGSFSHKWKVLQGTDLYCQRKFSRLVRDDKEDVAAWDPIAD